MSIPSTSSSLTTVRVQNKTKRIVFRGRLSSCNTLFPEEKDRPCPERNDKVQAVCDSKHTTLSSESYRILQCLLFASLTLTLCNVRKLPTFNASNTSTLCWNTCCELMQEIANMRSAFSFQTG
jgi:hypothetical protein